MRKAPAQVETFDAKNIETFSYGKIQTHHMSMSSLEKKRDDPFCD